MFDKNWLQKDLESHENFRGETTYHMPEKRLEHVRDHLLGVIEELFMAADPDMTKIEFCLEEVASGLGVRLPSYVS